MFCFRMKSYHLTLDKHFFKKLIIYIAYIIEVKVSVFAGTTALKK